MPTIHHLSLLGPCDEEVCENPSSSCCLTAITLEIPSHTHLAQSTPRTRQIILNKLLLLFKPLRSEMLCYSTVGNQRTYNILKSYPKNSRVIIRFIFTNPMRSIYTFHRWIQFWRLQGEVEGYPLLRNHCSMVSSSRNLLWFFYLP